MYFVQCIVHVLVWRQNLFSARYKLNSKILKQFYVIMSESSLLHPWAQVPLFPCPKVFWSQFSGVLQKAWTVLRLAISNISCYLFHYLHPFLVISLFFLHFFCLINFYCYLFLFIFFSHSLSFSLSFLPVFFCLTIFQISVCLFLAVCLILWL